MIYTLLNLLLNFLRVSFILNRNWTDLKIHVIIVNQRPLVLHNAFLHNIPGPKDAQATLVTQGDMLENQVIAQRL